MEIMIRKEDKKDYEEIYKLIKKHFGSDIIGVDFENDKIKKLRESCGYMNELTFVAEENKNGTKKIVAHIMIARTFIFLGEKKTDSLIIISFSVLPEFENTGVDKILFDYVFNESKKLGYKHIFVVGDMNYYLELGFKKSIEFDIRNSKNIPDDFVLAKELEDNSLKDVYGAVLL